MTPKLTNIEKSILRRMVVEGPIGEWNASDRRATVEALVRVGFAALSDDFPDRGIWRAAVTPAGRRIHVEPRKGEYVITLSPTQAYAVYRLLTMPDSDARIALLNVLRDSTAGTAIGDITESIWEQLDDSEAEMCDPRRYRNETASKSEGE